VMSSAHVHMQVRKAKVAHLDFANDRVSMFGFLRAAS
jgi:hypothetical protein